MFLFIEIADLTTNVTKATQSVNDVKRQITELRRTHNKVKATYKNSLTDIK